MDTLAFGARGGAGARTRPSMMETLTFGERGFGAGGAGVRTRPSNERGPSHQSPGHLALGQLVSARSARSDGFDEYEVCHQPSQAAQISSGTVFVMDTRVQSILLHTSII